jgi:hypothetical protein
MYTVLDTPEFRQGMAGRARKRHRLGVLPFSGSTTIIHHVNGPYQISVLQHTEYTELQNKFADTLLNWKF